MTGAAHDPGYEDLGFARLDTDRADRTGDPEVVYGGGKSPTQVVELLGRLHASHPDRAVLATRLTEAAMSAVGSDLPAASIDDVARAAWLGPLPPTRGRVCIVSAGTSDAPVAREAAITTLVYGADAVQLSDVGVAGVHRLLAVKQQLDDADCLVVVAGMEGALPSVVGGLTGVPLVAVPTSVGYGASFGGIAALLAMLNSCAAGVTVVNIDNGYGAGVFAARVARRSARAAADPARAAADPARAAADSARATSGSRRDCASSPSHSTSLDRPETPTGKTRNLGAKVDGA